MTSRTSPWFLRAAWICALVLSAGSACKGPPPADELPAEEPAYIPKADFSTAVSAEFRVEVDPQHPALRTTRREPVAGPATVTGLSGGSELDLVVHAKTIPVRPDRLWLEVYAVNRRTRALRDVTIWVNGGTVYDASEDPFTDVVRTEPMRRGGVAPLGVVQTALMIPADQKATLQVTLRAQTTERLAQNSAPIQVTPDGAQVWTVVPDADQVVVLDAQSGQRQASIQVGKRPTSLTLSPDGALALVASAGANEVAVLDTAQKKVVQTLTEQDGLGRELRHIVTSPDGAYAYVSAYVGDSVTQLRRLQSGRYRIAATVPVGRRPTGLSVMADGAGVLVTHFLPRGVAADNETFVSVLQTSPFQRHHEVIFRDIGNRKEAACLATKYGQPADKLLLEGTATQLWGAFLPPGGGLAWIPGLRVGPSVIWELSPGKGVPGIGVGTFSPGTVFYLDARSVESAAMKQQPLVLDLPDASLDFLRCVKTGYESESPVRRVVDGEPTAQWNDGAAVPTGITGLSEQGSSRFVAFTPGGRRALVLSYVADEIQVFDGVTQHPTSILPFVLSGQNPTGLAVSPDGRRGYVSYSNSLFVSVLDLSAYAEPQKLPAASYVPFEYRKTGRANNSLFTESRLVRFVDSVPQTPPIQELGQIAVLDRDAIPQGVRRGRVLFASSNPTKYPELAISKQGACETCHPGGGHDGAVWATVEGERRTLHLYGGVAGRGWLHQSGTHRDILEFVHTVVPERLRGKGLSEEDYRQLADYVAFHIPRLQPPRTDAAAVARGQALFAARCTGCHAGDKLTGGQVDPADPWGGGVASGPGLVDVGTKTRSANVIFPQIFTERLPPPANLLFEQVRGDRDLGDTDPVQKALEFRPRPNRIAGQIRPPSLVNVWDYSVFFHSGAIDSLRGSIEFLNTQLQLRLSPAQLDDLEQYLKTL